MATATEAGKCLFLAILSFFNKEIETRRNKYYCTLINDYQYLKAAFRFGNKGLKYFQNLQSFKR